jgi:hypothetical protein
MSEFPTSPIPKHPYEITAVWKTIITAFDAANEQRRQKQAFAKYDVNLVYDRLTDAEIMTLWNFYQARKGAYEAFYFYTLETSGWEGLYIGTGDGTTVTFDLPGKSTSSHTIYSNGSEVDSGDYTILTGGGAGNSDRITFDVAPVSNTIITCDFTGYMRIRCRFEEDRMTKQWFEYVLFRTGLKLKGLAPA